MTNPHDKDVDLQAADWFARRQRDTLTPGEREAFDEWMAADPARAVAYARVEAIWERAGRLRTSGSVAPNRAQELTPPGFAIAALLIVAVFAVGIWIWPRPVTYTTNIGEQKTVVLEDGSEVVLNTATVLRIDFDHEEREVELIEGEALFDISDISTRPFVVVTKGARVRALGTVFGIEIVQRIVDVTVVEGAVSIDSEIAGPADMTRIRAGNVVRIESGNITNTSLDASALRRRLAWRDGFIELQGETLAEAVAEFNRYREKQIVINDPGIASVRVGGAFRTDEADKFLAALESTFNIRAREGDGGRIYLAPAT